MGKIYRRISAACFALMTVCSCSDVVNIDEGWDEDMGSDGAPVIRKITASSDTTSAISVAALNQSIAVFGDNLAYVEEIMINDVCLDLSQIYAKKHRLELVVPRVLPGAINNTIRIRTADGEVSAPLEVTLPKLGIKGFSNDFAADMDTVQVIGNDFDLYKIDTVNARVALNGQDIKIFNSTRNSFSFQVPVGTPADKGSVLTISSPTLKTPVKVPFRDQGIPILTNDDRTWVNGWWNTGIVEVKPDSEPAAPLFKWYVPLKKTFDGTWGYENIMVTHFWLDQSAADLLAHPEDYVVKFELLNPAEVPMARYVKMGNADLEGQWFNGVELFYMWDPASSNGGVSLNTMGLWQTISLEATAVFPPSKAGEKTSLKIAEHPYDPVFISEANNFKMAMNKELAGDVEFYFWNLRFMKKISIE